MTAQYLVALSIMLLSACGWGQSLPYGSLKTLEDCARELRQIRGVTAELKLAHTDAADTRSFQIFLETTAGRTNIPVKKDGTFRLPELPVDAREGSRLTHSLEKGALTVTFAFFWNGELPEAAQKLEGNLFTVCSTLGSQFDKFEPTFAKLTEAFPEFQDFQMAIIGVSLPREKPCTGFAYLKKGDKTVATIDLSETGTASWMFEDYDPKTHRIVWDVKHCDPEPKLFMEMKWGRDAFETKAGILVRKTK
jgi:hypothetical protein